jgi:hypothetical protein
MDFPGETVTGHRRCRSQVAFVDLDLDGNELGGAVQWSPPLEVSAVQALCNRYPWDTLGIPLGYPWDTLGPMVVLMVATGVICMGNTMP